MKSTEPLIAGNTVLSPGSYVWKLLEPFSNRHVVQIADQRTGVVAATILAIPNYRQQASADNSVGYWETPKGLPRAVRSWFSPGDNYGQEFVYPREFIAGLASLRQPEPTAAPVQLLAMVRPPVRAPETAPAPPAPEPAGQQGSWAVISGAAASPTSHPDASTKRHMGVWDSIRNLPLTATLAPLIGLVGLLAFILWLFSHFKRKHGTLYTVGDDSP